jgi:hypothetical protein
MPLLEIKNRKALAHVLQLIFTAKRYPNRIQDILQGGNAFLPEAISAGVAQIAGGGSIFGIDGTMLWAVSRCSFNPKYWATGHAGFDIASGKNAFPAIQTIHSIQQ